MSDPLPDPNPVRGPGPQEDRADSARDVLRVVGVGALGGIGGLLLALIVQDVLATIWMREGAVPVLAGLALGSLVPVLTVLGALVTVLAAQRGRQTDRRRDLTR